MMSDMKTSVCLSDNEEWILCTINQSFPCGNKSHLNFKDLIKLIESTDGVKLIKNKYKSICKLCQEEKPYRLTVSKKISILT